MIREYLQALREKLAAGDATEHTHRSTLEALVKSFDQKLQVTNEPKRIKLGAPDLIVRKKITRDEFLPVGYIETKDIGIDLNAVEKSEQLERYRQLPNLILTDYLEFRWYVNGEKRLTVRLGTKQGKKIKAEAGGEEKLKELLDSFLAQNVTDISRPKELAQRMAGLCRNIDRMITETFAAGEASDLMKDLKGAFERTLLPEITDAQFADMFSQTLGYGLFAARIHHHQSLTPPTPGEEKQKAESGKQKKEPPLAPPQSGGGEETPPNPPAEAEGNKRSAASGGGFTRTGAAREIPKSNPFLRDLFYTIHSPDLEEEPFIGFVDDLTAVLAHTDVEAVLAQFGKRSGQEDPILHFYETFLAAYDPKERKRRGVYYTPEPVVSYIVRSVDILLKEKFGLAGGLADESTVEVEVKEGDKFVKRTLPKVLILDPACGTGTFLYAVVDLIRARFMEQKRAGEWRSFVREHLIPRIYGFELQMAPYAVSHLKLAMQLAGQDLPEAQRKKWGYEFDKDERLNVYLTNSLEYTEEKIQMEFGFFERAIAQEARAARAIKGEFPIMVVIGNPPYSGLSANMGEWIQGLLKGMLPSGEKVDSYYEVDGKPLGEKKLWLQDDYVKFLRWAQWRISITGEGIVGMITNHSYLDNPTFRGMRQSLMNTFNNLYFLDLHGNSKKKEVAPDGSKDENVFDIQQGVAIGIFERSGNQSNVKIEKADVWGMRPGKYEYLLKETIHTSGLEQIEPAPPYYLFNRTSDEKVGNELEALPSICDVFPVNVTGIVTARDAFVIDFDPSNLERRISQFIRSEKKDKELLQEFELTENYMWRVDEAHAQIKRDRQWKSAIISVLYRPFDIRAIINHPSIVWRPRTEVMRHMLAGENLALCIGRAGAVIGGDEWNIVFCSRYIDDFNLFYRGGNLNLPLYLYSSDGSRTANIDRGFAEALAGKVGMRYNEEKAESGKQKAEKRTPPGPPVNGGEVGPEDIFYYIYAVFHSPTYRERYKEFLKIDFPRVPLVGNREVFLKLIGLGRELAQYHLLEHPALNDTPIVFPEPGENIVEKVAYDENKLRVYINKTQYFEKVAPEVWEFHVGGYQVCQKWLKDRKGRALAHDDVRHYEKTVMALGETIRLMTEIDEAIPGWPME